MSFSKTTSLASLALTGLFVVFKFALASTTETPAPIECTAGATKTVDAPSSGSVVFRCGDKLTISPSGEGDVFYGKECTDSRKLTTVLPGAPAGRNNDGGSSAPTPKDCKLIVRVPGADGRVTSGFDPVSLTGKVLAPGLAGLLITFV
uniref:Surface antigen 2 n=1 Tax=Toxoplasma gondii TaxID=5811 RepID=I7CBX5_TOXGO|nr:surface antigen 2 [Toxoplasma gondii]AFO54958.1 surface antigen 2 [Toxoplasma gondii]AFO54959.1 surface antigen 2 [Toxoplasma gondii]